FSCSGNEFRCENDQCIDRFWKCDGHADCSDLSDELGCPGSVALASSEVFNCDRAFSIPMKWRCDGSPDCEDETDEEDCEFLENEMVENSDKKRKNCLDTEFRCPRAFCIQKSWLCDRMNDCPNGEDESNCDENPCEGEFRCLDGSGCVSKMVVCDGVNHCSDSSDEAGCPPKENMPDNGNSSTLTSTTTVQPNTTTKPVCDTQTHYLCPDDTCIPNSKLCDGHGDCKDR
ncbi:UNVERIFIED_CONTAM: hypothetical protein GTU68_024149, partial [Idotea baltica]|nr:hypothetical protein [Idotea baltica]